MGEQNIQFHKHYRVCNDFKSKILNDPLCYEVDPEKIRSNDNRENDLKLGLSFVMDYNEDRQVSLDKSSDDVNFGIWKNFDIMGSHDDDNAIIYLNTIGVL